MQFKYLNLSGEYFLDRILATPEEMAEIFRKLASSIVRAHPEPAELVIVGVQRRGVEIASRLAEMIGNPFPVASLNISLYRDDWTRLAGGVPAIARTYMPCSPDGKTVLLVDDVLFSGRTARAAIEAILDYGRPAKIELLAFIDRGHRELPICADYVGKIIPTQQKDRVDVLLKEHDGKDAVVLGTFE